jgi:hypothetical protein
MGMDGCSSLASSSDLLDHRSHHATNASQGRLEGAAETELSRPRDEDAYCRTQINLRRSLDVGRAGGAARRDRHHKANALW